MGVAFLYPQMLDTDEERRIHIPDIRKHIWFTKELPPHLDEALKVGWRSYVRLLLRL